MVSPAVKSAISGFPRIAVALMEIRPIRKETIIKSNNAGMATSL